MPPKSERVTIINTEGANGHTSKGFDLISDRIKQEGGKIYGFSVSATLDPISKHPFLASPLADQFSKPQRRKQPNIEVPNDLDVIQILAQPDLPFLAQEQEGKDRIVQWAGWIGRVAYETHLAQLSHVHLDAQNQIWLQPTLNTIEVVNGIATVLGPYLPNFVTYR